MSGGGMNNQMGASPQGMADMNYRPGAPVQAGAGYRFDPAAIQQLTNMQTPQFQQMPMPTMPTSPWAGMPTVAQSVQQIQAKSSAPRGILQSFIQREG